MANSERMKEYLKGYYRRNKEKAIAYQKAYYQANKDSPEYKAKRLEQERARRLDPAYRAKAAEYRKAYRQREKSNPEWRAKRRKAQMDRYYRLRDQQAGLFEAFYANGCVKCGEKNPVCLDAHHLDPKEKDFNISKLRGQKADTKRLEAELAKCICVCANCHRILHAEEKSA